MVIKFFAVNVFYPTVGSKPYREEAGIQLRNVTNALKAETASWDQMVNALSDW
jgi:hypothetical protein